MGGNSKVTYVRVYIGHESFALEKPLPNNHRFRWVLFVRPIVGNKFTDRSFLSKVEVELHPTFANPFRVLKEPPFELEETGYASFTPKLTIYFNTPHAKPYPVQYDMNLKLEKHAFHQQELTFAMSDVPASFLELVKRFCGSTDGKRKKRDAEGSSNRPKKAKPSDGRGHEIAMKEVKEEKKKEKDRDGEKEKKEKKHKRSSKDSSDSTDRETAPIRDSSPTPSPMDTSSAFRTAITPQRPVKVAPNKAEDRGQDSSSDSSSLSDSSPSSSSSVGASSPPTRRTLPLTELHRRLTSLTDENVIFRVAEILLTHPTASTMLLPSRPSISFDLTSADAALVAKLSHALMS